MEPINETIGAGSDFVSQYLIPWGINLAMALVVFIIGRWLAKMIAATTRKVMTKGGVDAILTSFLGNIIYTALLVAVVIAALNQLGVDTTSVLAVFAAAGLAVGLALKDSLSNFSAGVMLILFKPFKIGDFIEAAGVAGVVEEIRIFNTLLRSGDNREINVPNSQIYGGTIINVTARDTRRVDMVFGVGYSDDIRKAKDIINKVLTADSRILKDPAPTIAVLELAESSVNIAVRPWVNTGDYWGVYFDLNEKIKNEFDANGISIPFPQRDMHVYEMGKHDSVKAA